jgi:phytoene desaturase
MTDPIVIIGAGVGGLSAAIRLAAQGKQVLVLEKNDHAGGKMSQHQAQGYRWDSGPSVITMLPVFEELFQAAGKDLADYLTLQPVDPLTRYFYPDGTQLDLYRDLPATLEQIEQIAPRDVDGYRRFLAYAAEIHRITGPVFIYDQPPQFSTLLKVRPGDMRRVDAMRTMQQAIESHVRSPHLRQLLGRFATYVGASPYLAPATLNVIAHVELNEGVWYPQSGIYSIALALQRLAQELGVEIRTGCQVEHIEVFGRRARGVELADGSLIPAAAVIANLDVTLVYENLLPQLPGVRKQLATLREQESSCSGFILLLGVQGEHPELAHHNIFFSSNYRREFEQIFHRGVPPDEPTIYVSISARSTPGDAPPGCENWFVLVNAPPLGLNYDWDAQSEAYSSTVLDWLAQRGYDVRQNLAYQQVITPLDLEKMSNTRGGALYGTSSNNRWAAFRRPHNRCPDVGGLYFAGGTTHPGGGVPMVILSGKVASQLLLEDGY